MTDAWTVHTDVFDGPLDLLLYLVRRDGIDLRKLSVTAVADSYLAYLERMRELHLGVAAEYLVMAATLVHLKSLSLLPRAPTATTDDGEVEDPAAELARRLLEYQAYKTASEHLDERVIVGRDTFVREPEPIDDGDRPLVADTDAFGLLDAYYALLIQEAEAPPTFGVTDAGPDLQTACRSVLAWLDERRGSGVLGDLLGELRSTAERVVAFVAVLEMARLRWVEVMQGKHLDPVDLIARVGPDVDLSLITGEVARGG